MPPPSSASSAFASSFCSKVNPASERASDATSPCRVAVDRPRQSCRQCRQRENNARLRTGHLNSQHASHFVGSACGLVLCRGEVKVHLRPETAYSPSTHNSSKIEIRVVMRDVRGLRSTEDASSISIHHSSGGEERFAGRFRSDVAYFSIFVD